MTATHKHLVLNAVESVRPGRARYGGVPRRLIESASHALLGFSIMTTIPRPHVSLVGERAGSTKMSLRPVLRRRTDAVMGAQMANIMSTASAEGVPNVMRVPFLQVRVQPQMTPYVHPAPMAFSTRMPAHQRRVLPVAKSVVQIRLK